MAAVVRNPARAVLLEQTDHARASGLSKLVKRFPILPRVTIGLRTPPLSHIASGAVAEFCRAAKNQNLHTLSKNTLLAWLLFLLLD